MANARVLVNIPTRGMVAAGLLDWCVREAQGQHWGALDVTAFAPFDAARMAQVRRFLARPEYTHILFLDDDVVPPPHLLDQLVAHDLDIVAAPVPAADGRGEVYPVICRMDGGESDLGVPTYEVPWDEVERGGLVPVDVNGLACCLISRRAIEACERPWFRAVFNDDGIMIEEPDFWFSRKLKAAGYQMWVDCSRGLCQHYKLQDLRAHHALQAQQFAKAHKRQPAEAHA